MLFNYKIIHLKSSKLECLLMNYLEITRNRFNYDFYASTRKNVTI